MNEISYIVLLINVEDDLICSYGPFPLEEDAQKFINAYFERSKEEGYSMEIVPNRPPILETH